MTQFTPSMIPSSIVTTEALAVWLAEIHSYLYPNAESIEFVDQNGEQVARRLIESNKFLITAVEPAEWRHLSRLSVRLRPEHQVQGRLWEHVQILGDLAVPLSMRNQ